MVHDSYARAVYDPPGPIAPGKGTLVHLTSSRRTPGHSLTVASGGETQTLTVPQSPCPTTTTSTTKPHGTTTTTGKGTTTTSKTPTSSVIPATVPPGPGRPGRPG